jgi:hypothetical protein
MVDPNNRLRAIVPKGGGQAVKMTGWNLEIIGEQRFSPHAGREFDLEY